MTYMTQNLLKRGHTWYVRYIVPRKFRDIVGKSEIVRSLKTRDLDEARKRKHAALDKIVKEVEAIIYPHKGTPKEALEQAVVMRQDIVEADNPDLVKGVLMDIIRDQETTLGTQVAKQMWAIAIENEMPVSVAAQQYVDSLVAKGKVTKGTIDGRHRAAKQFVADMGDIHMSKITPRLAIRWFEEYLEPSGREAATLGRYISSMALLWKWAARREMCAGQCPFDGLSSELERPKKRKRAFTDAELTKFLKALKAKKQKHPEEYDVGLLLIESGARLNEIAELRVKDVYADGEVHIHDGKTKAANRCIFFHSDRAQKVLAERVKNKQPEDQLFEELKPGGQDRKLGHALSKRMRRTLAEVIPDAKEQGLDLHSIRRWAGTILDNCDAIPDRTLRSRMLGHRVGDMMGDVYSDGAEKGRVKKAFAVFSDIVQERIKDEPQ